MENIKGFSKLTLEQQILLTELNIKHKSGVGNDYKEGWTPTSVEPIGRNLRVTFKDGEWLHYTPEFTWY